MRTYYKLHNLAQKYKEVVKRIDGSTSVDRLISGIDLPYNVRVMIVTMPPWLKVSPKHVYDGVIDSMEHLENVNAHMTLHGYLIEVS